MWYLPGRKSKIASRPKESGLLDEKDVKISPLNVYRTGRER
jgi:hypothetical protein